VLARGGRRFQVTEWVEEEPFPKAEVEFLDEFEPADVEEILLEKAERSVRATLAFLKDLDLSLPWPTDIELSEDPVQKAWQLAGIAPLGTLDHQDLLQVSDIGHLLRQTTDTVEDALATFRLARDSGE
jgi:Lon protease-like protein